jgi:thioredoxin-like negative regulator of GroEL
MNTSIKVLETQADFETLWFGRSTTRRWIVYFTASWCKACKKLDLEAIAAAAAEKDIEIFKCDESTNEYTPGYCGIRSFPTFVLFEPQTTKSTIQSSQTEKVLEWIQGQGQEQEQ